MPHLWKELAILLKVLHPADNLAPWYNDCTSLFESEEIRLTRIGAATFRQRTIRGLRIANRGSSRHPSSGREGYTSRREFKRPLSPQRRCNGNRVRVVLPNDTRVPAQTNVWTEQKRG